MVTFIHAETVLSEQKVENKTKTHKRMLNTQAYVLVHTHTPKLFQSSRRLVSLAYALSRERIYIKTVQKKC